MLLLLCDRLLSHRSRTEAMPLQATKELGLLHLPALLQPDVLGKPGRPASSRGHAAALECCKRAEQLLLSAAREQGRAARCLQQLPHPDAVQHCEVEGGGPTGGVAEGHKGLQALYPGIRLLRGALQEDDLEDAHLHHKDSHTLRPVPSGCAGCREHHLEDAERHER